jgi:hypothetical protein
MLEEWLNPMKVSSFARDYLRTQPYASPSSANRAMPIFGWDTLDQLLTRNPPDLLVVARGKLLELPSPKTFSSYRQKAQRTIFFATIPWTVNDLQALRRISLDSAMKPHRLALLGCWQVIGYTSRRAGGMRQNASRIHFRFPSAFFPTRPGLPVFAK